MSEEENIKVSEIYEEEISLENKEDNQEIEKKENKNTIKTQEILLKNDNDLKINVDINNLPFKKTLGETVVDAHKLFKRN
jgi:hypothetical protein